MVGMQKTGAFRIGTAIMLFLLIELLFAGAGLASSAAVWPSSPGERVLENGKLVVDASHAEQGYVTVRVASQTGKRLKVRVVKDQSTLTYDLNGSCTYEVFPLQMGSGNYDIALYENASGTKYSAQGKVSFSVRLVNENAAFLVTNQYVGYDQYSVTVQKSDELCAGKSASDCSKTICDFMASEFAYDFVRAMTVTAGTLPEVDPCFLRRAGICQDLSAVMVCMLRVQGIPAKLVIGYADQNYLAWTVSVVDGVEIFFDPTAAVSAIAAKNYSVERIY